MLSTADILETINMIREENLDIRTVTMGISHPCGGEPCAHRQRYRKGIRRADHP